MAFLLPLITVCHLAAMLSPLPAAALEDLQVGMPLPPFSLPDGTGTPFGRNYLLGGPGVIIFWSTWSPRSAEILEDFKAYHRDYAGRGLKILAVNVDGENLTAERKAAVRSYLERMRLPFPALLDEDLSAFVAYGVMAHPSAVVSDREGRITYLLGGYPLTYREELRDSFLRLLGIAPTAEEVKRAQPPPPVSGERAAAGRHYETGLQLLALRQEDRALEHFRLAEREDPTFLEPAIMAARVSLTAGETAEAERLAAGVRPGEANRPDLQFLLGMLALRRGARGEADDIFRGIAASAPGQGWDLWGLGIATLDAGNPAAALELMEQARAVSPVNPEAEAAVREHLRAAWRSGAVPEGEDRFVALFPSLAELRDRYRRMRGM